MTEEQIRSILSESIKRFKKFDLELLRIDVNERSLTHKFAEHLQYVVGDLWNVDCEYNRYGKDKKLLDEIKGIVGSNVQTDSVKTKTVYPDIIVHKRGKCGSNLLVIEAKKNPTNNEKNGDIAKLTRLQNKFGYSCAVFLEFDIKKKEIFLNYLNNSISNSGD